MLASLVFVALVAAAAADFQNEWDQPLDFSCPDGEVLDNVYSVHDNSREDRRWELSCSRAPAKASPKDCSWTSDFVNKFDEPITFVCPVNGALAGVYSVHANAQEDRRWKFRCCRQANYKVWSCDLTEYENEYDQPLNFTVAPKQVVTGWFSHHDNAYEDRRHKFLECFYRK